MCIVEIIFSPTGGTASATHQLAEALQLPVRRVDLTDAAADFSAVTISPDDVCIIAVPAYGGRMPAPAASRLASMQGHGARTVLMAVYGNREQDDTLLEMQDISAAAGFMPVAAIAAVAEHSLARQYGAGRPDAQDRAELAAFAEKIRPLLSQAKVKPPVLPGHRPYKAFGGVPAKPAANDQCRQCGLCAARCPVQAIDSLHPALMDESRCITCMRCAAICPAQSRQISPAAAASLAQKLSAVCSERKPNRLYL